MISFLHREQHFFLSQYFYKHGLEHEPDPEGIAFCTYRKK